MIKPPAGVSVTAMVPGSRKIIIVTNWDEELRERVSAD